MKKMLPGPSKLVRGKKANKSLSRLWGVGKTLGRLRRLDNMLQPLLRRARQSFTGLGSDSEKSVKLRKLDSVLRIARQRQFYAQQRQFDNDVRNFVLQSSTVESVQKSIRLKRDAFYQTGNVDHVRIIVGAMKMHISQQAILNRGKPNRDEVVKITSVDDPALLATDDNDGGEDPILHAYEQGLLEIGCDCVEDRKDTLFLRFLKGLAGEGELTARLLSAKYLGAYKRQTAYEQKVDSFGMLSFSAKDVLVNRTLMDIVADRAYTQMLTPEKEFTFNLAEIRKCERLLIALVNAGSNVKDSFIVRTTEYPRTQPSKSGSTDGLIADWLPELRKLIEEREKCGD